MQTLFAHEVEELKEMLEDVAAAFRASGSDLSEEKSGFLASADIVAETGGEVILPDGHSIILDAGSPFIMAKI